MLAVQQQPTDLVLAVLETDLPHNLKVLDSAIVTRADWRFTFRIIGESHAITIAHRDQTILHEVLACVDITPDSCHHHQPFTALQAHHYTRDQYAVTVTFDTPPAVRIPPSASGIEVAFPMVHSVTPLTRIRWYWQGTTLHWWTLHLYPASDHVTAVHSHAHFFCA